MSNMSIRVCKEEDLNAIAQMFVEAFNRKPWNEGWSHELAYKRLEMVVHTPRFIGFVVEEEDTIIGALLGNLEYWYEGNHFNIKEFFIAHEAQGKGVGSFVLEHLKEYLKDYDVTSEELLTLNAEKTIRFYEKQGYVLNHEIVSMKR